MRLWRFFIALFAVMALCGVVLGISALLELAHASPACPAAPVAEPNIGDSFEVCHKGYESLVDPAMKETRFTMYVLKSSMLFGTNSRADLRFHIDQLAPAQNQAGASDYSHSDYDLGHMVPAEDFAGDADEERDTFTMANVVPQLPGLNRQGWERIEDYARAEACAHGEVWVFTGPIFTDGKVSLTIGRDRIPVPNAFFKIIYDPKSGLLLSFLAPNQPLSKEDALDTVTSVSQIEKAAGFDIPDLPHSADAYTPDPSVLESYRARDCK